MSGLSPRERFLILAMVVLGIGAALYTFVLVPQGEARVRASEEIARYADLSRRIEANGPAALAPVSDIRPVPAIVAGSARDAAIPIRRLEPEGTRTRLVLGEVAFAPLMTWLAALDTGFAIRVASIEMERRPEPGIVTARIVLER